MPDSPALLTVLTRDADSNRVWSRRLVKRGLSVYSLPCLAFAENPLTQDQLQALKQTPPNSWLIFTSAQGVKFFADRLPELGLDRSALAGLKIAAVGRQTADAITARGLIVTFTPSKPDAATLARELTGVKGHNLILLTSSLSDPKLSDALEKRGAQVSTIPLYATVSLTNPDPEYEKLMSQQEVGHVVFASPSAARAYLERLDPVLHAHALAVEAIAIGQTTSRELEALGFRNIKVAVAPNIEEVLKLLNYTT